MPIQDGRHDPSRALAYAVRAPVVVTYLGQLCLPLALAALLPLGAAMAAGSWGPAAVLAATAALSGAAGAWAVRRGAPDELQANEAMVVVALAFVLAAALMVPTFMAYGLAPLDAFFEAVSGVTTTGLSVVESTEEAPRDLLLLRSWLQWYGGLGFVTLSVLLVSGGGGMARLLDSENGDAGDLAASTRAHGRRALVLYSALTAAGIVLLLTTGASLSDAVVHAFSSVSTGGFSTREASLAGLGVPTRAVVALLFVVGALPLALVHDAVRGRWRDALGDGQLRGLLALGAGVGILLFVLVPSAGASLLDHAADTFLMAFSAQTTTGFSTTDPGGWPAAARGVLLAAMLVGGCVGSTAGGIKIRRVLVALRLVRHSVVSTALSEHAVREPELEGERIEEEERTGALVLVLLFAAVVGLSWLAFLAAGHPPMDGLFEVVSATGTVGLSSGLAGPELSAGLKWVLCLDMLMGRLEILALLVLLAPGSWLGRRRSRS